MPSGQQVFLARAAGERFTDHPNLPWKVYLMAAVPVSGQGHTAPPSNDSHVLS